MTENKRFEMKDPNCWGYPITDNKTGTVYNCNSNIWMKELVGVLNALNDENEQLKSKNRGLQSELQIFKEDVTHSNLQINKLADENKQLKKENQELRQDNDIKFWKHQFMTQHNRTQLILHELSLAMNEGYEVSDKFKEWLDDLTEKNKEVITKHERLFE